MKNGKTIASILGFVLVIMIAATAADAPKLTFKLTKANVPGAIETRPGGVNNAGVTVGQYEDSSMVFHGYILSGKKLTTLDDPKGTNTYATNIQYNGTNVVGFYISSSGYQVGFLYDGKTFTDITGPAGSVEAGASAINDKGAIVGFYSLDHIERHGLLLEGKTYTTLDVPGATYFTYAQGINNLGTIVVYWVDSSLTLQSSLTKNKGKTFRSINVPHVGTSGSACQDINNENDVVYQWFYSGNLFHSALLHEGRYYKFNYPKAVNTYASGINDKQTIVGWYQTTNGGPRSGYRATFK